MTELIDAAPVRETGRGVPFAADLALHGERVALIAPTETLSYRGLSERVDATASQLGAQRRLVLIAGDNAVEPIVTYLAALSSGHPVILIPGDNEAIVRSLIALYNPDTVLRKRSGAWELKHRHEVSEHRLHPDLALLLSTSGSTGSPKLVRLSHDNLQSNAEAIASYLAIRETDRAATTLPMHYCYGLSVVNSHLLSGAALVLTRASVVDPGFWDLVRDNAVTSFACVPYTFELLDRVGFAQMSLPSLRYVTQAGGRLAPEAVKRFAHQGQRQGWDLYVMYGQTEATARMAYLPPKLASDFPHSIGIPLESGSFRLEPVPEYDDADAGELVYCGPNVMLGYAEGPADLMLGRTVTHLRTGDVARRTDAGLYEVLGRLGRSVKLYGLRVDLDRVERVLAENDISAMCFLDREVLVVAVEGTAEISVVRAVLTEQCDLPTRTLRIAAVDQLPRLASGKPDYRSLQHQVGAVALPEVPRPRVSPDDGRPDAAELRLLFGELLDTADVTDESSFVSLGGDSLSYVEMSVRLEEALGDLPQNWHTMPIRELVPATRLARNRWRTIEVSVALRAVAIVLIVGTHANVFTLLGGAHALLAVVGFNFARFHLTSIDRNALAARLTASLVRIVVPAVVWIAIMLLIGSGYRISNVFLLNGFFGPDRKGPEWHFWFVESMVYILIAVGGLLVCMPWLHRMERRFPFSFPLVLLALALLMRYQVISIDVELARFKAHMVLWLFTLGWLTARAVTTSQRSIVTAAILSTVPGFFGDPQREVIVIVGLCLLVWVPSIRVPRVLGSIGGVLAASSLYIYLTHWQVYPHLEDYPLLGLSASLLVGIVYWRAMQRSASRLSQLAVRRHERRGERRRCAVETGSG